MLKVAFIILNWKNAPATQQCARSVLDEMERCAESVYSRLWIIDNGSDDNSASSLATWVENADSGAVSFIANTDNLGFSGGMNTGILAASEAAQFDYFWLLNNDLTIELGSLSAICNSALKDPTVAIWGSTIIDSTAGKVQCAGGCLYNRWLGMETRVGAELSVDQLSDIKMPELDYVYGAAMFVKAVVLERQNGLNEDYFLYYEELDLAKQLKPHERMGWCIDSSVLHKGGGSFVGKSEKVSSAYHAALSAFKFTRQYYPVCLPTVVATRALGLAVNSVRYWNFGLAVVSFRAFRDFLKSSS